MDSGSQLKKVRTFHTDMDSLRPAPKLTVDPVNTVPAVKLPPVMSPVKPAEPIPVQKKPEIASPILKDVPNAGLMQNVSKELGSISSPIPVMNDRINIMDADSEITEGTIITDQKRDRFKLFPAMAEAVQGWFQEGKEAIEQRAEAKRAATPTVSTLEDRKKIVQKAATASALAPKDDYRKLAAKIPTDFDAKAAEVKQTVTIKQKDPEAKPSWNHFEGAAPAKPEPEVVSTPDIQPEVVLVSEPVIPAPPVKAVEVIAPKPVAEPVKPVAAAPKVEPVAIAVNNKPATPEPRRQWRATPTPRRQWRVPKVLVYLSAIFVAMAAVGGGVAATMWFFDQNQGLIATTPTTTDNAVQPIGLLSSDRNLHLPLPRTRTLLYKNLTDAVETSGGITVLIPTVNKDGFEVPAETAEVLSVLDWKSSPTFVRSISEVRLGTLGTTPFIVARVSSFDTAFGGLLAAEEKISNDLTPLFGEIVTETFDPTTATSSEPLRVFFTDDVVRNHDVRVLRDGLEEERIVYGFVNQNTVIITTDRATFAALAEAAR